MILGASPFMLMEVEDVDRNWEPKLDQEYLVQYKFKGQNEESIFHIGKFHKQWYGYTFSWFWSAATWQLSTEKHSNDIENFLGVWEVHRHPEDPARTPKVNFVTKEEMNL